MRDRVIHYSLMWELISRPHRVNARKSSFCDKEAFIWDCKHHYMHSYVSHLFHIFKSVWALDLLTLHTCSFLTDWLVVTVLAGLNGNASCIHYTYKHSEDVCMHHVEASSANSQWKYLFSRLQAGAGNPGFPLCDYLIEWHTFLQGSMQWQLENICFSPQSVDAKPGWMLGFVWLLLQRYVKLASNLCDEVSSCIKGPPDFATPSVEPMLCTVAMDCGRSAAPDGVLMDVHAA